MEWSFVIRLTGTYEPGGLRVTGFEVDRYSPCSGPGDAASLDCTVTLQAFRPVRSTSSPSLARKADLTGDGVVNFGDLAKLKSVFFQRCQP
jgi:hypothetical protein